MKLLILYKVVIGDPIGADILVAIMGPPFLFLFLYERLTVNFAGAWYMQFSFKYNF